jgi:hypothetical protein
VTGGQPVRHDPLWPAAPARDSWLGRIRAGRIARRLAAGLQQELPGLIVDDRPEVVDGVWTIRVALPAGIVAEELLAATVAERVPWLADGEPGRARVPFGLRYSTEEQEQLVLVAAKVIHYLRQTG